MQNLFDDIPPAPQDAHPARALADGLQQARSGSCFTQAELHARALQYSDTRRASRQEGPAEEIVDVQAIDTSINDLMFVDSIQNSLKAIDENTTTASGTVGIAVEGLRVLAKKYKCSPDASFARENFTEALGSMSIQARDALLTKTKEIITAIGRDLSTRLANGTQRLTVQLRTSLHFSDSWYKEAKEVVRLAKSARSAKLKNNDIHYTNQIKIAHFTDGNFHILEKATDHVKSFQATTRAFNAVKVFLDNFRALYELKNGQASISLDEISRSLPASEFHDGRLSLTDNAAIFGEEFSINNFSGEGSDVRSIIKMISQISFKSGWVWRVRELNSASLAPIAANDIERQGEALIQLAREVSSYRHEAALVLDQSHAAVRREISTAFWSSVKFWETPKEYALFAQAYTRCILGFGSVLKGATDNQAKALMCLMDYYRWSLDQHDKS